MSVELYSDQGDFSGADENGNFNDVRYEQVSTSTPPRIQYVNESGLPEDVIDRHFRRGEGMKEVASIIEQWSQSLSNAPVNQTLDVFNRSRGLNDKLHIHAVMSRCAWAVENDDVLSTLADVIEGLMWQKCRFEVIDDDQQDFWNQWAKDVNLDQFLRQVGREELKVSQVYVGMWWENKVYSVSDNLIEDQLDEFKRMEKQRDYEEQVEKRDSYIALNGHQPGFIEPPEVPPLPDKSGGKGNRKRKKKFPVTVPTSFTIFDPTKVLPVGTLMFNRERFAYIATEAENDAFSEVMAGNVADDTVLQLIERKYEANGMDRAACADLGVDYSRLWLFKKNAVFRHTMTKSEYERYAPVRMKTVLPILEMKQHLRASDRASLIGNTNFIVVITKGTDKLPAKPAEIANLQEQARTIARLPVLVGDHRLNVEIVSPTLDNTLIDARWQVLDSRLVFTALKTFSPVSQGGAGGGGAGVKEMSQIVAKGLESRRHMIVRSMERHIFQAILDENEGYIDESPSLEFAPKRITLDFSADVIGQILKLRDRGDISRETMLEELDYDQDTEVLRRARERVDYDGVFESSTPFSSPGANPYGTPAAPPARTPAALGQPAAPGGGIAQPSGDPTSPTPPPPAVKSNLGPAGQPRTEGGRPPGVKETKPRATKKP